jgi:hypothetical protein
MAGPVHAGMFPVQRPQVDWGRGFRNAMEVKNEAAADAAAEKAERERVAKKQAAFTLLHNAPETTPEAREQMITNAIGEGGHMARLGRDLRERTAFNAKQSKQEERARQMAFSAHGNIGASTKSIHNMERIPELAQKYEDFSERFGAHLDRTGDEGRLVDMNSMNVQYGLAMKAHKDGQPELAAQFFSNWQKFYDGKDAQFKNSWESEDVAAGFAIGGVEEKANPTSVRHHQLEIDEMRKNGAPPEQIAEIQAVIDNKTAPKGKSGRVTTVGPDGSVRIAEGDAAMDAASLDSVGKRGVKKDLMGAAKTLSSLYQVREWYDPEYLTYQGWGKLQYYRQRDKLGKASPEQKAALADYQRWVSDSWEYVNEYIKHITGAQMSHNEAKRIMKAIPNPGDGFLSGDSPSEYQGKLDQAIKRSERSHARLQYINKHGLKIITDKVMSEDPNETGQFAGIELSDVDGLIRDRGNEIETILKEQNPEMSEAEIDKRVVESVKKEFGVMF